MSDFFREKIKADVLRWRPDFTALNFACLLLLQPGFQLAFSIRLQEQCTRLPLIGKLLRRVLWYVTTILMGSDIDSRAQFGGGIYFPHPHGIVIGGKCRIGRNVSILQNATLGNCGPGNDENPIIGDGVSINAGAVIVGGITIGANAIIGANAVVLKDVPANHAAVGVPARVFVPRTIAE